MRDAWWQGAVIYQIYPSSFSDSNGDGIGDLSGILAKLDYVAGLGVDAVWISPFFVSPMADFGYDVADYRDVDPVFGTLADFDRVLGRAHALGLKVLIDMVWGHTSDRHPWFEESRRSAQGPKANWYVWADPRADGTPPNNWLSVFGGPAWTWEPRRRQYYLHHFLASQPHLDLHHPAVLDEIRQVATFWLERGVDGFRLDAVDFLVHDAQLRDNPPARHLNGVPYKPFSMQRHLHDLTHAETIEVLEQIRAVTDRYPGTVTIAEVGSDITDDDALRRAASYVGNGGTRLDSAYSLHMMKSRGDAAAIRGAIAEVERRFRDKWLVWSFSNHDVPRVASRWGDGSPAAAKLFLALLLCLRGSVSLYQGEELGLAEAELPAEALRDPYGRAFWPVFKGRDGCRTPMPWRSAARNAGFSDAALTWLPVFEPHRARAVDAQEHDPDSVLDATRRLLRWRKTHPALRGGDLIPRPLPEPLVAFERRGGGERLFCAFNLSPDTVSFDPPRGTPVDGAPHGLAASFDGRTAHLPGFGACFVALSGGDDRQGR